MYKGLLFIGDPHLAGKGPGSRIDNFRLTGLGKLRQAFELARAHVARPIITGDLFHKALEADQALLGELLDLLWEFQDMNPCCIVGNHDKREMLGLTSGVSLQLVFASRLLQPLTDEGEAIEVAGEQFWLFGLDHGKPFPAALPERSILVAHHDLSFPGCEYPGVQAIPEIPGVVLGVNGHIHKAAAAPLKVGEALWFNPGNLLRVNRGERTNEPGVLLWTPAEGGRRILLSFAPAAVVFQTIGPRTAVIDGEEVEVVEESKFGALVAAEGELSAQRTSDGSFLLSLIDSVLAAAEATEEEANALRALHAAAVEAA